MSLFRVLVSSWHGRKMTSEELARQIANSQWVRVWERLSDQVWQMSRHERRGYIRARGALLVQVAVERALSQHPMRRESLVKLYTLTMDQVVSRVVEHMSACLPQTKSIRRAA